MCLITRTTAPRRGVMLILSTLVVTFVGMTGVLGLWALSSNTAILVKMTGLATSAAYAGASAVDLSATSGAQEYVVINTVQARALARQAFDLGKASIRGVQPDPLLDDQILVYNVPMPEQVARSTPGAASCDVGINADGRIRPPVSPASGEQQYCWLAVAYLAKQPGLAGSVPFVSRPCTVGSSTVLCSMHYTSGVAVTVGYQVTNPCGGGVGIPFCQSFQAIAVGYADYTARNN